MKKYFKIGNLPLNLSKLGSGEFFAISDDLYIINISTEICFSLERKKIRTRAKIYQAFELTDDRLKNYLRQIEDPNLLTVTSHEITVSKINPFQNIAITNVNCVGLPLFIKNGKKCSVIIGWSEIDLTNVIMLFSFDKKEIINYFYLESNRVVDSVCLIKEG